MFNNAPEAFSYLQQGRCMPVIETTANRLLVVAQRVVTHNRTGAIGLGGCLLDHIADAPAL